MGSFESNEGHQLIHIFECGEGTREFIPDNEEDCLEIVLSLESIAYAMSRELNKQVWPVYRGKQVR